MQQIENIPIKKLRKHPTNPRTIDKNALQNLCTRIKADPTFFELRPCLVSHNTDKKNYTIYAGNQRFEAAKSLGYTHIPCISEDNVPDQIQRERMVADNLHHGRWDDEMLANEFSDLPLAEMGYDLPGLDGDDEPTIHEDSDDDNLQPGNDADAITKLGDIYTLNAHRLVCGDSTDSSIVEKCLAGNKPILMITDPPYGVNYDPAWRARAGKGCRAMGAVCNDGIINWAEAWKLFPGAIAYVWHASLFTDIVKKDLEMCGFLPISQIIWAKQNFALSRGDYHWQHEPCWYAVRKDSKHNWQGARDQSTLWEIANLNCFGKSTQDGEERTAHSTQKPVECMARPMRNNTAPGEGVYDPFLGSGTTLIAAEQLGRIGYGIELSPAYCDIIVARWVKFMQTQGKEYTVTRNGETV